ncbi:MAG: dihydropteroate synthase, partial [Gammaproteobacteria bacterium]|nr:dihydropteroate synthase [Gammaproteobacteria bacterium]NNC97910.1 dihydropteroate synthase [Gammaproteobacteria bacterium]NNM13568.1 dihydropteroate synthase [Gammaproteobacteria bacterium]
MGILNVTPDSFSDGGKFVTLDHAIQQALQMQENGAAIIDIGGESTRPGAESVTEDQELQRVIPIIEKLTAEIDAVISIDTSKAVVMYEAVQAGASMINDVYALRQPEALTKVAKLDVPVCLMHMQGQPRSMQKNIHYTNVVSDVCEFLLTRAGECEQAGVKPEQIILDPGFGFGKTLEHNYQLLNALHKIIELG